MRLLKIILFLSLLFPFMTFGQSKILNSFSETNLMGCSCYILEKNRYFQGNKYLGVIDFTSEWQDRRLEVKLNNRKILLRIHNTNVKSNHFGKKNISKFIKMIYIK